MGDFSLLLCLSSKTWLNGGQARVGLLVTTGRSTI